MKRSLQFLAVSLVAILMTTGCYNAVEQQLQYGDYDAVLSTSLDRINKSRKKDEYISMALRAYNKVMDDDRSRIGQLKSQNTDGRNWGKIYFIYEEMENRQRAIRPYLPLTYLNGSTVDVKLFDLNPVIEESRENAALYHYDRAITWLNQGDRLSARNAYSELDRINLYQYNYRDVSELRNIALEQGTNKVLINFKTDYGVYPPGSFVEELAYYDYESRLGHWSKLYRQSPDSNIFDFTIELTIESLDISPQHLKEIHYVKEKEVEDGHQPLVDHEGNYVTDSSGNIIQVPKYKNLTCHITEWAQSRSAVVVTGFEIYDMRSQRLMVHQDLEDHAVFENCYAIANGHLEILPNDIRSKLDHRYIPFPDDLQMIMLTSSNLKQQIGRAIQRNQYILDDA